MRKIRFVDENIYHIYNRGVEKRKIFLNNKDYFRFIHNLFEFNDEAPAINLYYKKPILKSYEAKPHNIKIYHKRKLLVEILIFCLMPNHFHLLLKQKRENGVSEFMHKLGTGYSMYFNQKYERTGSLFQGTYKAVPISSDAHFIHLPYYIHLNALDLIEPNWRNGEIKNLNKAIKFLENYRWSSYLDYIGKKNFPSVTSRNFLLEFFNGPKEYQKETIKWLKQIDLREIKEIALESNIYEA